MKFSITILAVALAVHAGQAQAQQGNAGPLKRLNQCNAQKDVPIVREADTEYNDAGLAAKEAGTSLRTFAASCAKIKDGSMNIQNTEAITQVYSQGSEAIQKGHQARQALSEAANSLQKAERSLGVLAPGGQCTEQIKAAVKNADAIADGLENQLSAVKDCQPSAATQGPECQQCMAACPHNTRELKSCDSGCPGVCLPGTRPAPRPRPAGGGGR